MDTHRQPARRPHTITQLTRYHAPSLKERIQNDNCEIYDTFQRLHSSTCKSPFTIHASIRHPPHDRTFRHLTLTVIPEL